MFILGSTEIARHSSNEKAKQPSFFIFSLCISYACSAMTSRGVESFLGRPLGRIIIPAAAFRSLRLLRVSSSRTTSLSLSPNSSATSLCVFPSDSRDFMTGNSSCSFSYFLGIILPPDVALLFSYIRGFFVYGPFLPVRFTFS